MYEDSTGKFIQDTLREFLPANRKMNLVGLNLHLVGALRLPRIQMSLSVGIVNITHERVGI